MELKGSRGLFLLELGVDAIYPELFMTSNWSTKGRV